MRKIVFCVVTIIGFFAAGTAAQARPHDDGFGSDYGYQRQTRSSPRERAVRYERGSRPRVSNRQRGQRRASRGTRYASLGDSSFGASYGGLGPRPRAWCGWWMRSQLGGGPALNLAWNWRNYGRPASPQVGAVVVWRHHVGMITGQAGNGLWIVKSGNDGGAVRERARSVSGAIFRI